MANITPVSPATFDDVYQIETTDLVLGGAGQTANRQAQSLVNRTQFLKDKVDNMPTASEELKNKTIDSQYNTLKTTAVGLSTSATPKDVSGDSVFTFNANNTVVILGTAPYIGCKITFVTWNYTGYVVFKVSSDWKCVYMFAGQRLDFTCTGTGVWRLNDGQFLYVSASDIVTNAPNNPDTSVQLIPNDWRENYGCNIFSIDYAYAGSSSTYGTPDDRCVVTVKGVYARRIAQAQKWQNTGSPTPIWINKKHDSTWEGWNQISTDTEATTLENKTIDADNNTLKNVVTKKNISNCIIKIPQDITLTLSSGTLTLKSGSKVYYPDGLTDTTPKFSAYTLSSDKTITSFGSNTGTAVVYVIPATNAISYILTNTIYSGGTDPGNNTLWYDTTNNNIRRKSGAGVITNACSFPIAIVNLNNGTATEILQVFNGMGYIGSTIFALPGMEILAPNGRNSDGTLKTNNFTYTQVSIATASSGTGQYLMALGNNVVYNVSATTWIYNEATNVFDYYNDNTRHSTHVVGAYYDLTNGAVSNFKPRTPFHAIDYSDPVLQGKTIDYGDVTGGNTLKCTPKTYTTGDATLTSSEMAKELSVVMSSSYMCLTIQNAPYIGYRLSIAATTTGYIKFKGRQGNDVVLCIDARQTLYLINETSNYWTVEPGCCLIVDNNKINNAPWINPSDQTQGRWHPNDWRVFLGFGVFSFNYQQTSDTYYNLPDLSTFVVVSSTHQNRAVATAQKWLDKTTSSPIWTCKNHDGWATFWTFIPPKNEVVSHDNITNCITEIPQDITLTLSSDGTLTLKAGSKVYVPNGFEQDGTTKKFTVVTVPADKTITKSGGSAGTYWSVRCVPNTNDLAIMWTGAIYVSDNEPTVSGSAVWWDTSTNKMKYTYNSGSTWGEGHSLPIGLVQIDGTKISSITNTFNGMGYIGSTIFALPGVKALAPNGLNKDGSLRNLSRSISNVTTLTCSSTGSRLLLFSDDALNDVATDYTYDYVRNVVYNKSTGNIFARALTASYTTTSGVISNFKSKTIFHAVDYNEPTVEMVVTFSDNTTATYNVRIKE